MICKLIVAFLILLSIQVLYISINQSDISKRMINIKSRSKSKVFLAFLVAGLLCVGWRSGKGQNLVVNSNMETFSSCPTQTGQIQLCTSYESAQTLRRADYFNRCAVAPNDNADVPANFRGYQDAFSGDGYMGMILFSPDIEFASELTSGELSSPLILGHTYRIELWASLSDESKWSVDTLDFKFSMTKFTQLNPLQLAQIPDASIYIQPIDTSSWTHFQAEFTADNNYSYFTFGNFRPKFVIISTPENPSGMFNEAYIYIDDLSITDITPVNLDSGTPKDANITGIFGIDGKPQKINEKGIKIIKYDDGSFRKILYF